MKLGFLLFLVVAALLATGMPLPADTASLDPAAACNHEYGNFKHHEVAINGRMETCIYATCKKCGHVEHQYNH